MTEKESHPVKVASHRLGDRVAGKPSAWGNRNWRREINRLPDDDLLRVVRGMVSVDRAVDGFRRRAA
jgi:hypothetical protein